jgi:hypothetical protein
MWRSRVGLRRESRFPAWARILRTAFLQPVEAVVFNVKSGTVTQPDMEATIAARYGKDCGSENSAPGFTPEGKVVLALAPLADEIPLMNGAKSCVKRKTLLTVDISHGPTASTEPLMANFKVVRYGKFLESATTHR